MKPNVALPPINTLFGRQSDVKEILGVISSVRDKGGSGASQFIFISGGSGIGKVCSFPIPLVALTIPTKTELAGTRWCSRC